MSDQLSAISRRDATGYVRILAIILLTCCIYTAMGAPRRIIVADKPKAAVELAHQRGELPEATNPTPLSDELYRTVLLACDTYDVPVGLALGLIEVESGFDTEAVSTAGCYGLCQFNPDYFPSGLTPEENIDAGVGYLGSLLERYGDVGAALTAYNAGHDTGRREYAGKVLAAAEKEMEEMS